MIARQAGSSDAIGASETAEVFHRSRVGGVALGVRRHRGHALLEQQRRHPAPSEIHREGESDRSAAGDDDRILAHGKPLPCATSTRAVSRCVLVRLLAISSKKLASRATCELDMNSV